MYRKLQQMFILLDYLMVFKNKSIYNKFKNQLNTFIGGS